MDDLGRPIDPAPPRRRAAPDANDELTFDTAVKRTRAQRTSDDTVLHNVMNDPAGRAWMYRRLLDCHIYGSTFVAGEPDTTAYRIGEENIGKRFLAELQRAAPELYLTMLAEQQSKKDAADG